MIPKPLKIGGNLSKKLSETHIETIYRTKRYFGGSEVDFGAHLDDFGSPKGPLLGNISRQSRDFLGSWTLPGAIQERNGAAEVFRSDS